MLITLRNSKLLGFVDSADIASISLLHEQLLNNKKKPVNSSNIVVRWSNGRKFNLLSTANKDEADTLYNSIVEESNRLSRLYTRRTKK